MTAETYRKLGQAVFEVVVPKQDPADTFTYAEPLPRELLTFLERTDPYSSIGTAFCVGPNRFISASHVFALEEESVNSEFFIRDPEGKVYPVDTVYKYANHQDCIVFSVKNPPNITPLEATDEPKINTAVFTVGNAYGQGIIVRNGVLTSLTPEERDGAWKWLRFSAAASPGNSGGPLVDIDGKVLGITIARSENENFNLALPMQVANVLPEGMAKLNKQVKYGIPIFSYVSQSLENTEIQLPLRIDELKRLLVAERNKQSKKSLEQLLAEQKDKIFPTAKGSDYLLRNSMASFMPGVACEQSDYSWKLSYPQNVQQVQLADGSKLDFGTWKDYTFHHFTIAPGSSAQDDFFREPQKAMDDVLTGYSLTRNMAGKNIRITSLGKTVSTENIPDRFGREWQLAQWNAVFADWAIVWLRLPTPDGFVGIMRSCPMWDRAATVNDLRTIVDFIDVDYAGSVEQWTAFLKKDAIVPASLRAFRVEYAPEKKLGLSAPEFSVNLDATRFLVNGKTVISCYQTWTRNVDGQLGQNINALYLRNTDKETDGIIVTRITRPGFMDAPERATGWKALANRSAPFDGTPNTANGVTSVCSAFILAPYINGPCDPEKFLASYLIQLNTDTKVPDEAKASFNSLLSSVRITEQGIVDATGITGEGLNTVKILKDIDGMTIFEAIDAGARETLGKFISENVNLDAVDGQNRTPLETAILDKQPELAAMLVAAATGPETTDKDGRTPLILSLLNDYSTIASELIKRGADLNHVTKEEWTPLMYALRYASPDASLALLKAGAKPDGMNQNKWTPLIFALRYSTPEVIKALLEAGAPTAGANNNGWTPLMFALRYSTTEIADKLLDKSPDISARDSEGWNAFMFAISNKKPAQAKWLLNAGSDYSTPDEDGWTPLMYALNFGQDDIARMLIDKGANLTCVDKKGWTPLMFALRYTSDDISCAIIRKGGQTPKVSDDGWTELLFALRYEKPSAARSLIEGGANLGAKNSDGFTPLLMATKYSTAALVKALLEKGADTEARTKNGKTAIDLARELKDKEKIDLLSAAVGQKTIQ